MNTLTIAPADALPAKGDGVVKIESERTWLALLEQVPFPNVTQAFAYGEGKAAAGWDVARIAVMIDGRIAAICQMLSKCVGPLALARRINRGPMFLDASPGDAEIVAVHRLLRTGMGVAHRRPLLVAPSLPWGERSDALMRRAGYRRRHGDIWSSARVDLQRDEDTILASFAPNFRNKIRKAERAGVSVVTTMEPTAYDWLVARHREHMSELKLDYSGDAFFKGLASAQTDEVRLLRIVEDDSPVAAILLVRSGSMMEYNVGWYGEAARRLNAGNVLLWAAIREAKASGCETLDVGGLVDGADGGFSQFKRGLSGDEYTLAGEWVAI